MLRRLFGRMLAGTALAGTLGLPALAQEKKPITIGFGMALTGGLAPNGKAALLAMQIWEEEVNARGGLLGRPVKLIFYDDQSNPATVPGIYTKLLDVDKVDIALSGYATNMIAPAMPIMMQRKKTFLALFGLAINSEFKYPNYFALQPAGGPNPKQAFAEGFFEVAMAQTPKPQTLAIVGADAEFPHNAMQGARELAKKHGLRIVYDKTYPPPTTDYAPIVRAIQATDPDLVLVCSYPPDSVGMVRAANEIGLKARMFGGGMVGLQSTAIKMQLGPLLNGIVNYDFWLPVGPFRTPEAMNFLAKYQAKAKEQGVDLLGYYLPPFAYAYVQVLEQAITAAGSVDQQKYADALRKGTFKTVVGEIKFGPNGEWVKPRVLAIQFQGITGNSMDQFTDMSKTVILWPPELKAGNVIYPYAAAKR